MDADALPWDELQSKVLRLLDELVDTLTAAEAHRLLAPVAEGGSHATALRAEAAAIRGWELRMSIAAPLKAGKSTLINAIIGDALLPARATATTTMLTRVELAADAGRPSLVLTEQTREYFEDLLVRLREELPDRRVDELAAAQPLLADLLRWLSGGRLGAVPASYAGREEVRRTLAHLNDLVGVAAVVGLPGEAAGAPPPAAPVLRTPYRRCPQVAVPAAQGILAVVDTPSADERGMTPGLTAAVGAELRRSDVVLVLLDYTRMSVGSDATVRRLAGPILDAVDGDRLHVAVNKIDQRPSSGDTSTLAHLVSNQLGLPEGSAVPIFEISAHHGLAAARVLAALDAGVRVGQFADHAAFQALAEILSPSVRLRQQLLSWPADDWREEAQAMWEASGLPGLLEATIAQPRRRAVARMLTSALARVQAVLTPVGDTAALRSKAGAADRATVEAHLNGLRREVIKIGYRRAALPRTDVQMRELARHLHDELEACLRQGDVLIRGLGIEGFDDRGPIREALFRVTNSLVNRRLGEGVEGQPEPDEATAQAKIDELDATATATLRALLDDTRAKMTAASTEWVGQRVAEEEAAVRSTRDWAERLGVTFEPRLGLPTLEFPPTGSGPHGRRSEADRGLRADQAGPARIGSLRQLRRELAASFAKEIGVLRAQLQTYVSSGVNAETADFHRHVDDVVTRHQHGLEQALADWQADQQHRADAQDRVKAFAASIDRHREQLAALAVQLAGGHAT